MLAYGICALVGTLPILLWCGFFTGLEARTVALLDVVILGYWGILGAAISRVSLIDMKKVYILLFIHGCIMMPALFILPSWVMEPNLYSDSPNELVGDWIFSSILFTLCTAILVPMIVFVTERLVADSG